MALPIAYLVAPQADRAPYASARGRAPMLHDKPVTSFDCLYDLVPGWHGEVNAGCCVLEDSREWKLGRWPARTWAKGANSNV